MLMLTPDSKSGIERLPCARPSMSARLAVVQKRARYTALVVAPPRCLPIFPQVKQLMMAANTATMPYGVLVNWLSRL